MPAHAREAGLRAGELLHALDLSLGSAPAHLASRRPRADAEAGGSASHRRRRVRLALAEIVKRQPIPRADFIDELAPPRLEERVERLVRALRGMDPDE